jgi:hypothetical protein
MVKLPGMSRSGRKAAAKKGCFAYDDGSFRSKIQWYSGIHP